MKSSRTAMPETRATSTSPPMETKYNFGSTYGDGLEFRRHLWRCSADHIPETSGQREPDRKSTRLNSSHVKISYAVFCLKKKRQNKHRGTKHSQSCTT